MPFYMHFLKFYFKHLLNPCDVGIDCVTAGYLQVHGSHGRTHMETYRERVQDAVIEEPFVYLDCYDNSARFSPPPSSHVTKVHVELVRTASSFSDCLAVSIRTNILL